MEFGKESWRSYETGITKEWLLTNGIGGFAASTVTGINTRRYHGLLVAALNPPAERHLVLSKIDESLQLDGREYELYSHEAGGCVKNNFIHQQRFELDPLPVFTYSIEDAFIEKTICMVYGENTTVIRYRIINGSSEARLRLTPLVNFRDYHHTSSRWHMQFARVSSGNKVEIKPYGLDLNISLICNEANFCAADDSWFENMNYALERERGLDSTEDHYIPGSFEVSAGKWEDKYVTVIVTTEKDLKHIELIDGDTIIENEKRRLKQLVEQAGYRDSFADALVLAADKFIVYRKSTGAKTVIAGYPWFTDWGRDTMIAVSGLTLAAKRFDDAEEILSTFSKYIKHGLVPNVFPDAGQEPSYNSVDAALWYFEAIEKFIRYTGRYAFVKETLYTSMQQIIDAFMSGTLFGIRMDKDSLINAGNEETQLTWMDAKVGPWVVTPRQGKVVEINALWYNALAVMDRLAGHFGDDSSLYRDTAGKVRENFVKCFWNEHRQCLYDVVQEGFKDEKIRPNQILAVSLSYPVLDGAMAEKTVETVWKKLYTAYGLRSLSPDDPEYRGIYAGDQYSRDGAYHQGTVWAWLAGPFITAFARVFNNNAALKDMPAKFLLPFRDHLKDACLGSISEIFDGDEPLKPRGCFAQAWSVGEILRVYVEEVLQKEGK